MKNVVLLVFFYLGLWGVLGFFATILLGFLSCCAGLSEEIYFGALISFAIVAVVMTCRSVAKCRKHKDLSV
ncbi:MAG TPA: hypothetical protein VKA27_16350 [Sunxiuqinia sp.]|nr:hypothetical protein [Sunxiuqinia sp.]